MSRRNGNRPRRPRRNTIDPQTGLGRREKDLVGVLAALHREFGLTATFPHSTIQHVTREAWAGSLAGLCEHGYAQPVKAENQRIGYRLTEKGWALHAGVPLELADGQGETLGPDLG